MQLLEIFDNHIHRGHNLAGELVDIITSGVWCSQQSKLIIIGEA